jgi:GIY-YIG catalytic domain
MNIYVLINKANNKRFVGKTAKNMAMKLHNYRTDARRWPQSSNPILRDINHYGELAVRLVMLETCKEDEADARVEFWINYLGTRQPKGYNYEPRSL